jgi:hypothetical protein
MSERINTHTQDPNERQDYKIDWAEVLQEFEPDDTIASATWTVSPTGPTIDSPASSHTTTTTTVWISNATAATDYQLEVTVTTAGGRILQGHLLIRVRS